MLGPVTHIRPITLIQRTRKLPMDGQVLVRAGQDVAANDVIATAKTQAKHYMIYVADWLGVSERDAEQYIQRELNDELSKGDIVARKPGLFPKDLRSPVDGRIVLISGSVILVAVKTAPFQLLAGIPGRVTDLLHDRGVVITNSGALAQGIWGNGKISEAPIVVLAETRDHVLEPNQILDDMKKMTLLAGYCGTPDVFARATEIGVSGLVLGSMESELIPAAQRVSFPVIVLDGFGRHPMNAVAHKFLSTSHQRTITINAERANPETGMRPEVFLPVATDEGAELPYEVVSFKAGQRVRILRPPHHGEIGTLQSVLPGRTQMPNGLRTIAANVNMGDDEKTIQVPLANLEILS